MLLRFRECSCGSMLCFLGFEWFPRMDVVESGTAYVVTVELPGVNVDGIRVEIDHGRYL
jgi:HSP20 family molecular chaperone IbpA